jgi:hypothetical protein
MNLLVFATAFGVQYLIGAIIELFPTTAGGGYALESYRFGFGACLLAQIIGMVWYILGFRALNAAPSHEADAT